MTTERSGRHLVGPISLSSTMTIQTHLEDTIDRPSAETSLLVVSDSHIGSLLTSDIDATGTHLITDNNRVATQTRNSVRTTVGDLTAAKTLKAGIDATVAVVALQRDRQTLLVAQLLRTQFKIDDIVVLLNDPDRREAFDHIATSIVCVSTCLSVELRDAIEQILPESPSHS